MYYRPEDPIVRGGQGRSNASAKDSGVIGTVCWILAALLVLAVVVLAEGGCL